MSLFFPAGVVGTRILIGLEELNCKSTGSAAKRSGLEGVSIPLLLISYRYFEFKTRSMLKIVGFILGSISVL